MTWVTWEELAVESHEAAMAGGATWAAFVAEAVKRTGRPWRELRVLLDPYVARYLASQKEPA